MTKRVFLVMARKRVYAFFAMSLRALAFIPLFGLCAMLAHPAAALASAHDMDGMPAGSACGSANCPESEINECVQVCLRAVKKSASVTVRPSAEQVVPLVPPKGFASLSILFVSFERPNSSLRSDVDLTKLQRWRD